MARIILSLLIMAFISEQNIITTSADDISNIMTEQVEQIEQEKQEEREEARVIYLGRFKTTAYCGCRRCCGKWAKYHKTASGTTPQAGRTIAVSKSQISFGSTVVIDEIEYIAEDTGGAIKQNRIDIYFDTHSEALQYGVQYKDVYILEGR